MRALFLLASALVPLLAFSTMVSAHAEPATITPGAGAVLKEAPAQVVIVMSQEMAVREGQNDIDVFDASGKEITVVAATIDRSDRRKITVPLPSNLGPGTYTVKWKTLSSDDGDPAEGPAPGEELTFTVDPNGQPNPGKTQLREDLLGPGGAETPAPGDETAKPVTIAASDGVTWVLVVAVGLGMFVLGAGGAFLLVQKRT